MQNIERLLEGVNDTILISSERISKKEVEQLEDKDSEKLNEIKNYQSLWRAVITQALMDAGNNCKKPEYKKIKAEAISWLSGYSDGFEQVCIMADLPADYVKQKAKEAIKRGCKWRNETGFSEIRKKLKTKRLKDFNSGTLQTSSLVA